MPTDAAPQAEPAAPPEAEFFCPRCDYSLRGIDSDRCPECGVEIDRADLARSRIPWVHRRQIGRVRAYLRTVWRVSFHPIRFTEECARPVSYPDARRFWLVTALLISLSAGVAWTITLHLNGANFSTPFSAGSSIAMAYGATPSSPLPFGLTLPVAAAYISPWASVLSLFLFLLTATGVPAFLVRPRWLPVIRQNRAVALIHYNGAPLVWMIPAALLIAGLILIAVTAEGSPSEFMFRIVIGAACAVLFLLPLFKWWTASVCLVGLGTGRSRWGILTVAAVLPMFWFLSALVCLVALPWSLGLFMIIVSRW